MKIEEEAILKDFMKGNESKVSVNVESTSTESRGRENTFELPGQQRAGSKEKENLVFKRKKKLFRRKASNQEMKQFRTNVVMKDATWIHM
eukprot:12412354-Karenia_brevis.AAC.1